jgi:hypothetical protein
MQDFYIQQRTPQELSVDQIQRWFLTVDMLAPEGVVASDDDSGAIVMGTQGQDNLYIISLVRHLTADEANRIVEGYMRITEHDFEIESSNVYRADADLGHPFAMDIQMAQEARSVLADAYKRQAHNEWIKEMMGKGYRYGLNMSVNEKTHPAMRPYDELPENYRKTPEKTDQQLLDYYSRNVHKFT